MATYSFCGFELKPLRDVELSDALAYHAESLKKDGVFLRSIRESGGSLEFYVGWFVDRHVGDIFDFELLKAVSSLGINLTLEIYGPDEKHFEPTIVKLPRVR